MGKKIQCIGRYALEGQLLGKGSFARVELAHHSVTGCKVAIKIIDTRKLKEKTHLNREAIILAQLRHPNIVRLYETMKATTLYCLVLEYASGGELQAFIKIQKDFRLSEERGRPYIRQLVSALHYLHERGVAHRDLKMENILLDTPKKNVKLVDFGLSNTFSKDKLMETHCGSPEYAAPELFTAGEKYGLEIDIWSLGIVMYAMMVGKLPFVTPYTDQYRRQKLVQQMERGLVDMHSQEMNHLSPECQDILHKIIQPLPNLRLSLLDMEIHPWFTESSKKPFFPFLSYPRDKTMKAQTFDELATALGMRRDVLEQKVAENKADETSAMFNMILDKKRQQQGIFEMDHTLKSTEKKEPRGKRSKSAQGKSEKQAGKKGTHRGPPALCLPPDDSTGEPSPHSGAEPEHETKFSSFDFLALCSTPTWLGPERRRSRRRSRSPMPSVQQQGNQGLSLRNQMKRDYLERQAIEMEREVNREEKAATAGLLSPDKDVQQLSDHHGPVGNSLSVPGNDSALSHQNSFRRGSIRISRRRTLSCGSSLKRKNSYRRSGSVDHRIPDKVETPNLSSGLASSKDGRSAPAIVDKDGFLKEGVRRPSLKIRKNSTLESNSQVENRKRSVDFADSGSKNFLGVLKFGIRKNNYLSVPTQGSNNNLLRVPEVDVDGRNLLQVPSTDMGSNPLLCVSSHDNLTLSVDSGLTSPNGSKIQSPTRPGKLILKECYSPPKQNKVSKSSTELLPLLKPLLPESSGLLTSVEVHYADMSNPSSAIDLDASYSKKEYQAPDVQHIDSLDSFLDRKGYDDSSFQSLLDNITQKKPQPLSLSENLMSSLSCLHRKSSSSNQFSSSHLPEEGAVAMQNEIKSTKPCNSKEDLFQTLHRDLKCKDQVSDIEHNFHGLVLSSEGLDENEDHADSMTELISDSPRDEVLSNSIPSITSPGSFSVTHKVSRQSSEQTPEEDFNQMRPSSSKGSGSVLSFCRSSASSRKPSSSKARSPTTPTWLNLRTPLARIESFHSNDFECFMDSDNDEGSTSSTSVTTPTVPCFAYKFQVMKKKQSKLKQSNNSSNKSRGCGSVHNNEYLSSKMCRSSGDKKHMMMNSGHTRLDMAVTDPLLSSGSDTEHHDDGQERLGTHGKSKIHPIGADERESELLNKCDARCLPYHNTITRQPNQIMNMINRLPKIAPEEGEQATKKKAFVKHLAWRKSFTQFLKRKRHNSPLVTPVPKQQQQQQQHNQQIHQRHNQQPSPGNNNNNDLTGTLPETRNGISTSGHLQTKTLDKSVGTGKVLDITLGTGKVLDISVETGKVLDRSTGTDDLRISSQDGENLKLAATTLSPVPVESIVTELIELQSSPKIHCPPSPSRAFDFSLVTDSPKMKSSCLMGWGTCGDCAQDDYSSEEEVDYITTTEPTAVTLALKPLGENKTQGNLSFPQTNHISHT